MPLPQLTRAKLAQVFKDPETLRAFEALLLQLRTAPEDVQGVDAAAAAAQQAADDAQAAADAAAASAGAAAAAVTTFAAAPFVTVALSGDLPNERALAVDAKAFALVDTGAGAGITLNSADLVAILPADVSDTTGAFVNATGLALSLLANATYIVDALVTFQSAATTNGAAFGFTVPAGASISGLYAHNSNATGGVVGSWNNASGAVGGVTTATGAAAANVAMSGRWVIKTGGTAGSAQMQFYSENAGTAITLKADLSVLVARRIA